MDFDIIRMLLCFVPFVAGLFALVVFGFLLVGIIQRQFQPKKESNLAVDQQIMRSQLESKIGELRPWEPGALSDLSTDWDATWKKFGRDLSVRGVIPSLAAPKGPGWVAFSLRVRGARQPDGLLTARTNQQVFEYRLKADGISVDLDGAAWGQVDPKGYLLDAHGEVVGSAPRPGGSPVMVRAGSMAVLSDQRERSYPVTLNGRVVAQMSNPAAQMTNVISLRERQIAPAVTLETQPSEDEANWLLALAILQVACYNVLETVWTN